MENKFIKLKPFLLNKNKITNIMYISKLLGGNYMGAITIFIIIFVLFIIIRNSRKPTTETTKSETMATKNEKAKITATVDEIPEAFIEFPEYHGDLLEKPVLTTTKNYTRLTMLYNDYIDETYFERLNSVGFKKASAVRYDRNDTYIIVEEIDDTTKVAFHIKKEESNTFDSIDNNNLNNSIDSNNPISFS